MKKNSFVFIHIVLIAILSTGCYKWEEKYQYQSWTETVDEADPELASLLKATDWETTKVATGITWKRHHFTNMFGAKQYVTVFDIDLNKPGLEIKIPYVTSGFILTSTAAAANDADIAFNGSHFDAGPLSDGGSLMYLKLDGMEIVDRSGLTSYRNNGAFYMGKIGVPRVARIPTGTDDGTLWRNSVSHNILAGGPLLIYRGQRQTMTTAAFNTTRSPRTAIGLTINNHILAVVVDGSSTEAAGMSTPELVELMLALGCVSALNLAGDDASTAWVKGEGVVNHPSGNGLFDHKGERGVPTIFTVRATQ